MAHFASFDRAESLPIGCARDGSTRYARDFYDTASLESAARQPRGRRRASIREMESGRSVYLCCASTFRTSHNSSEKASLITLAGPTQLAQIPAEKFRMDALLLRKPLQTRARHIRSVSSRLSEPLPTSTSIQCVRRSIVKTCDVLHVDAASRSQRSFRSSSIS